MTYLYQDIFFKSKLFFYLMLGSYLLKKIAIFVAMRILLIQTAFLGDVILVTPLIRALKLAQPNAQIDVLVRKGNESLLLNNPNIHTVLLWDKKNKYKSLFQNLFAIRGRKYTLVVCIQRYFNAGFLTAFSGAKNRIGFRQNPWSWTFSFSVKHQLEGSKHEVERNFDLVKNWIGPAWNKSPELFLNAFDEQFVQIYKSGPYYCFAPASVWYTKQLPEEKWIELSNLMPKEATLYFLGAPGDFDLSQRIINKSKHPNCQNLCGKLSILQSAALMRDAKRSYVNDSGPLHISSAVDSKVTAFFCSTIPAFGFGPLSSDAQVLETKTNLACRPCGTHGFKKCPQSHFKCGHEIDLSGVKL